MQATVAVSARTRGPTDASRQADARTSPWWPSGQAPTALGRTESAEKGPQVFSVRRRPAQAQPDHGGQQAVRRRSGKVFVRRLPMHVGQKRGAFPQPPELGIQTWGRSRSARSPGSAEEYPSSMVSAISRATS